MSISAIERTPSCFTSASTGHFFTFDLVYLFASCTSNNGMKSFHTRFAVFALNEPRRSLMSIRLSSSHESGQCCERKVTSDSIALFPVSERTFSASRTSVAVSNVSVFTPTSDCFSIWVMVFLPTPNVIAGFKA